MADADIGFVALQVFWFALFAGVIAAFIIFFNKNPYVPRKYYVVDLKDKDGKKIRQCKGWLLKDKGVEYFRVQLYGLFKLKAVNLDRAVSKTIDKEGRIALIELVPDVFHESNYIPENVPLTQREEFLKEITELATPEARDIFRLKVGELLQKHSRMVDLDDSRWLSASRDQQRRESDRVKGNDWLNALLPIVALILAMLFCYLMIDSTMKATTAHSDRMAAVTENGYRAVVESCGGTYHPLITQNSSNTTSGGFKIPFVQS